MRKPRTHAHLLGACALAFVLGSGAAQAAPEAPTMPSGSDAIAAFLAENGLLGASEVATAHAPPLAERMREQASEWASGLVISAMNFLGVPYVRGGQTADQGFDCSGFTRHVFESSVGLVLPRRSQEQARASGLLDVARDELKPGDLVFFNTLRKAFSHVGIYVGEGKFIHAPRSGGEVRIEDMRTAYWNQRYNGARRAAAPVEVTAVQRASVVAADLPAREDAEPRAAAAQSLSQEAAPQTLRP